jgi:hypothetical protein
VTLLVPSESRLHFLHDSRVGLWLATKNNSTISKPRLKMFFVTLFLPLESAQPL